MILRAMGLGDDNDRFLAALADALAEVPDAAATWSADAAGTTATGTDAATADGSRPR